MADYESEIVAIRSQKSNQMLREIIHQDLLDKQQQHLQKFKNYMQGKISQLLKGQKLDSKTDRTNIKNTSSTYQITNSLYNIRILTQFQNNHRIIFGQQDQFYSVILKQQHLPKNHKHNTNKRDNLQLSKVDLKNQQQIRNSQIQSSKQPSVVNQQQSDDQEIFMDENKDQINNKTAFSYNQTSKNTSKHSNHNQQKLKFAQDHHKIKSLDPSQPPSKAVQHQPEQQDKHDSSQQLNQSDEQNKTDKSYSSQNSSQNQDIMMSDMDVQGTKTHKKSKKQEENAIKPQLIIKQNQAKNKAKKLAKTQQLQAASVKIASTTSSNNKAQGQKVGNAEPPSQKSSQIVVASKNVEDEEEEDLEMNDDDIR